jgi:hypothetical protein
MGRFVKNYELRTGSHAVRLPIGSNAIGPDLPVVGQVRYNVDSIDGLEYFHLGAWRSFAEVGRVEIVKDNFIGDGSSVAFNPMTNSYLIGQETSILVFVGNVFQEPGVAYSVIGNTITFTSAPDLGMSIVILHNFNSTQIQ